VYKYILLGHKENCYIVRGDVRGALGGMLSKRIWNA